METPSRCALHGVVLDPEGGCTICRREGARLEVNRSTRGARRWAKGLVGAAVGLAAFVWMMVAFDTRHAQKQIEPGKAVSLAALHEVDPALELEWFDFDLASTELSIVDVGMKQDLGAVRDRERASLVVNAGFFDDRGAPIGLSVSEGETLVPLDVKLGGGVLSVAHGLASLSAAEDFHFVDGTIAAVQSKPRLLVDGAMNLKSDDPRAAPRTALCVSNGSRSISVVVAWKKPVTLWALASALLARRCEQALNLDGGPSTGVAWASPEGPLELSPRGPIRQAIVFRVH